MTSSFVIGVDGGGTQTRVSVCDVQGQFYGSGTAGPGNYHNVGVEVVQESIRLALEAAWKDAGIAPRPASAAFLGLGSVVTEGDRERIRSIAGNLSLAPRERIGVDHDLRVAAAGAFPQREGIVLVAGTGSAAFGITSDGKSWRAGGWGPTIDDYGSGYWLGIQAMKAVVSASDGRGPTTLLEGVIKRHFGITDLNALMYVLDGRRASRCEIAAIASSVTRLASEGDQVSQKLVLSATDELAQCVQAVQSNLSFSDNDLKVAIVGGLVEAGEVFIRPLQKALSQRIPSCQLVHPVFSPVDGAMLLAAESIGAQEKQTLLKSWQGRLTREQRLIPKPHTDFTNAVVSVS